MKLCTELSSNLKEIDLKTTKNKIIEYDIGESQKERKQNKQIESDYKEEDKVKGLMFTEKYEIEYVQHEEEMEEEETDILNFI